MLEMVVIGSKAEVGETSLTASLAILADRPVIADCDIGAAGLQSFLLPEIRERHEFCSGHQAVVRTEECMSCGLCLRYCPNGAIVVGSSLTGSETYSVDPQVCQGCGTCVRTCPVEAIDFPERRCGEWIVSDTRCGPMVHAQLNLAAENSAELVSTIRREAHRIALKENRSLVIVNSPSGIGFPVAANRGKGAPEGSTNRRTHPLRPRRDLCGNTRAGRDGIGLACGGRYPQTLGTYDTQCICRWSHRDGRAVRHRLMLGEIQKDDIAVNVLISINLERGLACALEADENRCDD
jgi:ferredoxin